jgi:anti-sigma factor RsiW
MRCDRVRGELNAYVDGQLSEVLANQIERHLSECLSCAARVDRMRRLEDLLNEAAAISAPDAFAARVLGSARRQMRSRWATPTRSAVTRSLRRLAPLGAAAAAVLSAGFSLGTWMATETWYLNDADSNLAAVGARVAPDIGNFYGADSDELDSQRPLMQIYLAMFDRIASGE